MNQVTISVLVLGATGLSFSMLLAFLSKKLTVEEDPRVKEVLDALPGLNCGACGFSGCRAYAEAVVKKLDLFNGCLPGGDEVNKRIAHILGIDAQSKKRILTAVCHCGAGAGQKKESNSYEGPPTCKAAHLTGGALDCIYGCLSFGDCVGVCPVSAISLKDKKIYVDCHKCIGCGKCIKSCPRRLFKLIPLKEDIGLYSVACSNKDKGPQARQVCSRGCISCGLCTKVSNSPYYLKDNLSYVDYKNATQPKPLEEGKNKCPTKCIDKEECKAVTNV